MEHTHSLKCRKIVYMFSVSVFVSSLRDFSFLSMCLAVFVVVLLLAQCSAIHIFMHSFPIPFNSVYAEGKCERNDLSRSNENWNFPRLQDKEVRKKICTTIVKLQQQGQQ